MQTLIKQKWRTKRLGQLCLKITDGSHNPPKNVGHSKYLMLSSKNVFDDYITVDSPRYISRQDFELENKRTDVQPGDVLLTIVGTIGRVAVVPNDSPKFTLQRSVAVLKHNPDVTSSRFLMRLLQSVFEQISQEARGVAQKGLYLKQLRDFAVYIPESLSEQQRIVKILDEAFAEIDKAKENAEKNLNNSRELFELYLQNIFKSSKNDWKESKIGEIAKTQYGLSEKMNEEKKGFKIFRMGELQNGKLIDNGKMKYADIDRNKFEKYKLFSGDVLFNRTNSFELVGKTGIFKLEGDYCFASYLVRLNLDKKSMLPEFLNYYMNSKGFQSKIKKKASKSINQANINAKILSNESVRYPKSLSEQQAIVETLDELSAQTKQLEAQYQKELDYLEELKKSLLNKAFQGEL